MKTTSLLSTVGIGCLSLLLVACSPEKESASSSTPEPAAEKPMTEDLQQSVDGVVDSAEEMATEAKEMAEEAVSDAVEAGQAAVDDAVNKVKQEMPGSDAEMPSEADADAKMDDMKKQMESELKLP